MNFLIQSVILCSIFSFLVIRSITKNPLKWINDYPKKIQERVKEIPVYKEELKNINKHSNIMHVIAIVGIIITITITVWFSTNRSFINSFIYSFLLISVVNLWDLVVIDWIWFCNSKKVIIKGTQDLIAEYKNYKFHAIGFIKGSLVAFVFSLLISGLIQFIKIFAF